MRVLYSFPHRIGATRICQTAWHQVAGTAEAEVDFVVAAGSVARALPDTIDVFETLALGRFRLPYRAFGSMRMFSLHDRIVARWLRRHHHEIDLVHTWPCGALETLRVAKEHGIPSVLERPNAHTGYAYEVVRRESQRLGVDLPAGHEHAYNAEVLSREEAEYELADRLLCASEFAAETFSDAGHPDAKIMRHFYGVDTRTFFPGEPTNTDFTAIFVGVAAVRKGLHFALEAWRRSSAARAGRFLIAGDMLPEYRRVLEPLLTQQSVTVLGHSDSVSELMRKSHILLLPSIEEGFGLVCTEAMASGCVPLVSDACTDLCRNDVNSLVHHVGDVGTLARQISLAHDDRGLWERLRANGLSSRDQISWEAAGVRLAEIYGEVVGARSGVAAASA